MEQRLEELEARFNALEAGLEVFGQLDLEVASYLLGGWLALFIMAHGVGRVVRAMGKI